MSLSKKIARYLSNYNDSQSLGSKLRIKRIGPLLAMIEEIAKEKGSVSIIDIGGTETYWNIVPKDFLDKNKVTITLINLPSNNKPEDHGCFHFTEGDACDLSRFEDKTFDIAHSNSVIEHVGDWRRMFIFALELKRVANKYFVQTPNFWFPVEPHCMTPLFHWLPRPFRVSLVLTFGLGHWSRATSVDQAARMVDSVRLLDKKMLHALFEEGTIITERFFLLPKSYIVVKN